MWIICDSHVKLQQPHAIHMWYYYMWAFQFHTWFTCGIITCGRSNFTHDSHVGLPISHVIHMCGFFKRNRFQIIWNFTCIDEMIWLTALGDSCASFCVFFFWSFESDIHFMERVRDRIKLGFYEKNIAEINTGISEEFIAKRFEEYWRQTVECLRGIWKKTTYPWTHLNFFSNYDNISSIFILDNLIM